MIYRVYPIVPISSINNQIKKDSSPSIKSSKYSKEEEGSFSFILKHEIERHNK